MECKNYEEEVIIELAITNIAEKIEQEMLEKQESAENLNQVFEKEKRQLEKTRKVGNRNIKNVE